MTRVDEHGIPCIVQSIEEVYSSMDSRYPHRDAAPKSINVVFFNGASNKWPVDVLPTMGLDQRFANFWYETMERIAISYYWKEFH